MADYVSPPAKQYDKASPLFHFPKHLSGWEEHHWCNFWKWTEIILTSPGKSKETICSSEAERRCHVYKGGFPRVPPEHRYFGQSKQLRHYASNTENREVKNNSLEIVILLYLLFGKWHVWVKVNIFMKSWNYPGTLRSFLYLIYVYKVIVGQDRK